MKEDFGREFNALKKKYPGHFLQVYDPSDFESRAGRKLTPKECTAIVESLNQTYDATSGVNWDTIEQALFYAPPLSTTPQKTWYSPYSILL